MRESAVIRRSPFFYVGDKYKLLKEIKPLFPFKIGTFVEPFLGGGSAFLNVDANAYILNDIDQNVIFLHNFLTAQADTGNKFFKKVRTLVEKYDLSRSYFEDVVPPALKKEWVKTYYAHFNRMGYERMKADYNKSKQKDPLVLYLLLIYGFNRMLRFNKNGEFNIPVGNVDFNKNVVNALQHYFDFVNNKKITFSSKDFRSVLSTTQFKKDDFVYVDPPYLISSSEYNKLWAEKEDADLMSLLDELNKKGIRFAMSNITTYNGRKNKKLISWMKGYNVHPIKSNYISYHDNTKKEITEVLITNY